jgi:hypothetical protein
MAGRFEGVSDLEWRLFEDVFPLVPPKRGRGMPHVPFRKILNTLELFRNKRCGRLSSKTMEGGHRWGCKSETSVR